MARWARVVVPGVAHHVTQRGNRRQPTFFQEEDYAAYLALLSEWCGRCGVAVWTYCLMPNHVHLIVVPDGEEGLRQALVEARRRYTRRINFREGWRGFVRIREAAEESHFPINIQPARTAFVSGCCWELPSQQRELANTQPAPPSCMTSLRGEKNQRYSRSPFPRLVH